MSDSNVQRPAILLVGTGHWDNPGLDLASVEFDDMLSPRRQREIEDCLGRLADFSPTKVALEVMPNRMEEWNAEYRAYRQGRFTLTENERYQLGFRLAAMANHECIYGIDWHDLERPIGWERAITFARTHGQEDRIAFMTAAEQETGQHREAERERIRRMSVREHLAEVNAPGSVAESHRVYMDLARVGEGPNYVGADVVLRWYERNMMIFANLARIVNAPTDRILVIIGAGHIPLLAHFVESSGRFELHLANAYLVQ